ncbi:MAG: YDG domain-containing protein [Prevotellaceae bacterium]|nr:YDG domain-containing protein [Prevotellaceae bacterium]
MNAGAYAVKAAVPDSGNFGADTVEVGRFRILKRKIALNAETSTVAQKTYDGRDTANVDIDVAFSNLAPIGNPETLTLNTDYRIDSARFDSASVGSSRKVTAYVSLIAGGENAKNYAFGGSSPASSSVTKTGVSIIPKEIALDATSSTVAQKIYDGTDTANVEISVAFTALVTGDALTLGDDYTVDSARFDSKDVGSRTATVYVSLVAGGSKAKNYLFGSSSSTSNAPSTSGRFQWLMVNG